MKIEEMRALLDLPGPCEVPISKDDLAALLAVAEAARVLTMYLDGNRRDQSLGTLCDTLKAALKELEGT